MGLTILLKINLEIKDVFRELEFRRLLGQVHFNIYKNDNIKKSDLEVSKNFFEDNKIQKYSAILFPTHIFFQFIHYKDI